MYGLRKGKSVKVLYINSHVEHKYTNNNSRYLHTFSKSTKILQIRLYNVEFTYKVNRHLNCRHRQ